MSDIRTTTEEFSASGSLSNVQKEIESTEPVFESQETVQFLVKKIDELIKEVNILKNQLTSLYHDALGDNNDNSPSNDTDFTLPGYDIPDGSIHPLEQITSEIKSIFCKYDSLTDFLYSGVFEGGLGDDFKDFAKGGALAGAGAYALDSAIDSGEDALRSRDDARRRGSGSDLARQVLGVQGEEGA